MGGMGIAAAIASSGSKALALALVAIAFFRFAKWAVELFLVRLDKGDRRLAKRLEHVELELDCYRAATMLLLAELARESPANPALAQAATMLRKIPPRPTMSLDELERRLNAMPGKGDLNEQAA